MASGFELVGKAALGTVTSRVKKWIDLNKQHALDEALNEYLLEELPRLHRLMEERCADLEARGCTHSEASIIAYQVIEAQKRTIDEDKIRRLTNVLVNGFCAVAWDKATHRLMARLAAELEEEHIVRLKRHLNGPTLSSWNEDVLEADQLADKEPRPGETDEHYAQRKAIHAGVLATLDRELIAAGLLAQEQEQPGSGGPPSLGKRAYDEVITVVSPTGRLFLEYLRDPEELFAM